MSLGFCIVFLSYVAPRRSFKPPLIIESHQTIAVVAMFIHLPTAMLGDLYTPVNIQIAGIYPVMVLLLIDQENSLDQTIFSASTASTAGCSSSTSGPTVCHSKLDSSLTSIQLGPGSNNYSERTLTGAKSDGLTPIMED